MKKIWLKACLPIIILSLAYLVACGGQSRLKEVELLMETNVAAADSILSSLSIPKTRRDRALLAVLKTQADYKLLRDINSDSLIKSATDYYGTSIRGSHARRYHSALAWYSQGCVYSETGNDLAAIDAYLKAKDLFPDTINRYYALTEQRLGKKYLSKGMFDESYSSFNKCRFIAETIEDSALMANCDYHIALIKLQNYHYDGLIDSFKKLSVNNYLSDYYRNESLLQLSKIYIFNTCSYDSALLYIDCYIANTTSSLGAIYNLKGEIYYKTKEKDSAYYYYSLSLDEKCDIYTQCFSSRRLCELSMLKGNNNDAYKYESQYTQYLDSIRVLTNANDIAAISIAHMIEIEALQKKEFRTRVIMVGFLFILILFSVFYIIYQSYINKINSRYIKFSDRVWTTITTSLPLDSSDDLYLLTGKTKYLNSPSHSLLFAKEKKANYKREEKEAIKHDLSVAFSDLSLFMLNKYPTISKREIQICYLNYLKIDKSAICEIMDLSDDSFRKAKSRLKEKLGDSFNLYFT
ncbi:MAG: hypothetical protein J5705_06215 [Bacteroidaceae bacterium]|nr:hypothetical protein [Bacteroidaceae bacterium]